MNRSIVVRWRFILMAGLLVGLGRSAVAQPFAEEIPPDPNLTQGVDVLTQGPVHEAFANPIVYDPGPGPLVPQAPPEPIDELPPDQRPEGVNIVWIPGYWAWDDGRGQFLWVSGLWRELPPGRQWVPGYWSQAEGGFRWVPGAWTPLAEIDAQVAYLPTPPATLEAGPNIDAPGPDFFWSPGTWIWQETRYSWRPGFWTPVREQWVWVPAHYVWTPGGCLFIDGYWDQTIARRGVLFAPVALAPAVYTRPNFVYTPTIALVANALMTSLFVRPSYRQYYFGDYYAQSYAQSGIYPWYAFNQGRLGYDPLYSYYSAVNLRSNPGWSQQIRQVYDYRRDNVSARPARTFARQQTTVRSNINNINNITNVNNTVLARPIAQVAAGRDTPFRYERVGPDRREAMRRQAVQLRQVREQRQHQEVQAARLPRADQARPHHRDRLRSPIAAQPIGDRARATPRPVAPRPTLSDRPPPVDRSLRPSGMPRDRPRHEVMRPSPAGANAVDPGHRRPEFRDPRTPGAARPDAPRSLIRPDRPERPDRQPRPERVRPQPPGGSGFAAPGRPEMRREAMRPNPAGAGGPGQPPPGFRSPQTPDGPRFGSPGRPAQADRPERPDRQPRPERLRPQPQPQPPGGPGLAAPGRPGPIGPGRPQPGRSRPDQPNLGPQSRPHPKPPEQERPHPRPTGFPGPGAFGRPGNPGGRHITRTPATPGRPAQPGRPDLPGAGGPGRRRPDHPGQPGQAVRPGPDRPRDKDGKENGPRRHRQSPDGRRPS